MSTLRFGGCGAHEVIVESPEHHRHLAQQPVDQIACVLETLQWRYLDHQASFMLATSEQIEHLASVLRQVLLKLHTGLDNPDFNLTIDDVPRGDERKEYFLWHIRILPRLTTPAGFEMGSGMSINTVLPEEAAKFLNDVPIATNNAAVSATT